MISKLYITNMINIFNQVRDEMDATPIKIDDNQRDLVAAVLAIGIVVSISIEEN